MIINFASILSPTLEAQVIYMAPVSSARCVGVIGGLPTERSMELSFEGHREACHVCGMSKLVKPANPFSCNKETTTRP